MADQSLHHILEGYASGAEKKLIAAVADNLEGNGGPPWELLEWDIVRATGWTFDELDQQDAARVVSDMRLSNIRNAIKNVLSLMSMSPAQIAAIADSGVIPIDPDDMEEYGKAMKIRDEVKALKSKQEASGLNA